MASSSGLRISSLLRHQFVPPSVSNRFPRICHGLSELRFLPTSSSTSFRSIRLLSSRGGEDGGGGGDGGNGRVVHVELHKEATDAYMAYAMSVLLGRALPDVRDGLKPVHRRIL